MTTAVITARWTETAIQGLVIELLADLLQEDPTILRAELLRKGGTMPVDSLDMFDVLQEFRLRTGISLPVRILRKDTLRSVQSFAEFAAGQAQS